MLPSFWRGGWGTQDCPRWKRKQYRARVHFGGKTDQRWWKASGRSRKKFCSLCCVAVLVGIYFCPHVWTSFNYKVLNILQAELFFFGRAIFVFFHSANSYKPGIFRVPIRYLCIFVSQQKKKKNKARKLSQAFSLALCLQSHVLWGVLQRVGGPSATRPIVTLCPVCNIVLIWMGLFFAVNNLKQNNSAKTQQTQPNEARSIDFGPFLCDAKFRESPQCFHWTKVHHVERGLGKKSFFLDFRREKIKPMAIVLACRYGTKLWRSVNGFLIEVVNFYCTQIELVRCGGGMCCGWRSPSYSKTSSL